MLSILCFYLILSAVTALIVAKDLVFANWRFASPRQNLWHVWVTVLSGFFWPLTLFIIAIFLYEKHIKGCK